MFHLISQNSVKHESWKVLISSEFFFVFVFRTLWTCCKEKTHNNSGLCVCLSLQDWWSMCIQLRVNQGTGKRFFIDEVIPNDLELSVTKTIVWKFQSSCHIPVTFQATSTWENKNSVSSFKNPFSRGTSMSRPFTELCKNSVPVDFCFPGWLPYLAFVYFVKGSASFCPLEVQDYEDNFVYLWKVWRRAQ